MNLERASHPVMRVVTVLLAAVGLYPQYTALTTVLMVFGMVQVNSCTLGNVLSGRREGLSQEE